MRRFGLDDETADEVGQRVFIKLLSAIKGFEYRPDGSFRAYVKCVCQSAVVDFFQEQSRLIAKGTGDSSVVSILNDTPEIQQELADALTLDLHRELLFEAERRIQKRVRNPKNWDAYLELKEGTAGQQVADSLGMSLDSVYKAKERIVTAIRKDVARTLSEMEKQ